MKIATPSKVTAVASAAVAGLTALMMTGCSSSGPTESNTMAPGQATTAPGPAMSGSAGPGRALPRPLPSLSGPVPGRTASGADATYTDGVYRATGTYGNLPSHLGVTITLDHDVITAVEVATPATDPTSLEYQRRFAAAVPAVVIGKDIDDVRVGRLAGASGCPVGFNDALARIKSEARE